MAGEAAPARDGAAGRDRGTTRDLLKIGAELFSRRRASAMLVIADPLPELEALRPLIEQGRVVLACRRAAVSGEAARWRGMRTLELPDVRLGRSDQIKLAISTGLTSGALPGDGPIVALVGRHGSGVIDTAMVVDLRYESELLQAGAAAEVARSVRPAVFHAVLRLAVEIASEGREGRKVGTIFVVGDHERVLSLSRPLIFNPFHGYPEEERNICNPALWETIKEFAALDGAFLIREDGVVIAAGRYLTAAIAQNETLALGLGSRHAAASGITSLAMDAIAVAVSQSNGTVRVYKGGKSMLEIERPP